MSKSNGTTTHSDRLRVRLAELEAEVAAREAEIFELRMLLGVRKRTYGEKARLLRAIYADGLPHNAVEAARKCGVDSKTATTTVKRIGARRVAPGMYVLDKTEVTP